MVWLVRRPCGDYECEQGSRLRSFFSWCRRWPMLLPGGGARRHSWGPTDTTGATYTSNLSAQLYGLHVGGDKVCGRLPSNTPECQGAHTYPEKDLRPALAQCRPTIQRKELVPRRHLRVPLQRAELVYIRFRPISPDQRAKANRVHGTHDPSKRTTGGG